MTAAYAAYKSIADESGTGAAGGQEAQDQLVMQELPQVYYIAARLLERLPRHVELEDLVHAGVIGLLEASKSFDSGKNAQFKTFAKFRIRGAILDSLRNLDWGSRGLRRKGREIGEATARLAAGLHRQPVKEEIAAELKQTSAQLDETIRQLDGLHVVGQQTASGQGEETYDLIESAASTWENPFELYCKAEQTAQLTAAIAGLSEREQLILSLYYREELTMKEIAGIVGIALSRVSQIHFASVAKLKVALGAPADDEPLAQAPEAGTGAGRSARRRQP
ncbi:MAG TPA: FliA/WhiG family RNA polymerase sigma factor [Acidobacteriaceae bacterium]